MPYIKRDESNNIVGYNIKPRPGVDKEYLAGDDAELLAFKEPSYKEKRRTRYLEEGLTPESYIDAERKARAGDSTELEALDAKAAQIKVDIPVA